MKTHTKDLNATENQTMDDVNKKNLKKCSSEIRSLRESYVLVFMWWIVEYNNNFVCIFIRFIH